MERTSPLILLSRQQSLDSSIEEYYLDALSFGSIYTRLKFFPDFGVITYLNEGDAFCLTGTVHGT